MNKIFLSYLLVVNVVAFSMYFDDKQRAKRGKWRISEAALIIVAAIGGSIGALLGMKVFRHKTKHIKFTLGVPIILILQIILLVCIFSGQAFIPSWLSKLVK